MAKGIRKVAQIAVVAGTALASAHQAAAQDIGGQTVVLKVANRSSITPRCVEEAEAVASEIFNAIGVRLVWIDSAADVPPDLAPARRVTVVLPSQTELGRFLRGHNVKPTALGVAPHDTNRVYIFPDRIVTLAFQSTTKAHSILGRVLAHEIGHQLLPNQGHSRDGIMRADVNYSAADAPGFADDQAASIQTLLSASLQPK